MGKSRNPTPKPKAKKPAKRARPAKPADGEAAPKRLSGLDAAEVILRAAGEPLRPADIFAKAKEQDLWNPQGKTPIATLAAALCTSVKKQKGRFRKAGRGLFALVPVQ
jgi:hypothetical protein